MSELQKRLEKLLLRLDHMGLRVEQAVMDAIEALKGNNVGAGQKVDEDDRIIDREEVEIEQECIRLLALYQPAAIDLRTICMVIKVNSDLERIADKAGSIGRRVKHVAAENIRLSDYAGFEQLEQKTVEILRGTVRLLGSADLQSSEQIRQAEARIDEIYNEVVGGILEREGQRVGGAEVALTLILLARAFERISDLCSNIAEDVIFLKTGDIIRHPGAFVKE